MDVTFEGKSSTGKNEWLTPPHILRRLGPFDLDPCAPINRPWDTAEHHYTIEDDGIDTLKIQMQEMQERHGKQIRNLQSIHNQELEAKDREI